MNKIAFVWAEDQAGWIGKNGKLPWHLPADLQHFKAVTLGHPIVMGANTYASIGRPLPHRDNIVLSHHKISSEVVNISSINELKGYLDDNYKNELICVIGGAGLFKQTLPLANVLYRTVIEGNFNGDVQMVPIDYSQWVLKEKTVVPAPEATVPNCRFEKWVKL